MSPLNLSKITVNHFIVKWPHPSTYTMQLRQHVRDSLEWVKTLEKSTLCCVTAEIDPIYQQITVNHFIVKFVIYNATPTAL